MSEPFPRDSHVTAPAEIRRAMSAGARILARLEQGPAQLRELAAITVKYTQRVSDLRKAGHEIRCLEKPNGDNTYFLVKPRSEWRGADLNQPRDGRLV